MQAAKLLGSSPLVTNSAYTSVFLNPVFTQSLRWKRKPIWLPTAKTKVFRVPKKPKIPEDEFNEIQRLYNRYRTYLHTTIGYFREINKQNEIQLDPAIIEKAEQEDFEKCVAINDQWNKQIFAQREERLASMKEAKALLIKERIKKSKEENMLKLAITEEKVKRLKAIAPKLITRDNIDQAIADALDNPVNYNKAIDLNGEWYTEPTGIPPPKIPVTNTLKTAEVKQ